VEVHRRGRHDRGDREHDDRGDRALQRTGHHLLEGDEAHRERGEDAVLDLARVAELLHERQRRGLDALEEDGRADHPATSTLENNVAPAPAPPTPWRSSGRRR